MMSSNSQDEKAARLLKRQTDIRNKLQEPITSKDILLDLLEAPLRLLHAVPSDWPQRQQGTHAPSSRLEEGTNNTLSALSWISDIQRVLLEKVLVDWYDVLQAEHVLQVILRAYFAPEKSNNAGSLLTSALSTFSSMLSSTCSVYKLAAAPPLRSPLEMMLPAQTGRLLIDALLMFRQRCSLVCILDNLQAFQTATKASLIWNDVVREWASLPDRIANAMMGKVPKELGRISFSELTGSQLPTLSSRPGRVQLLAALLVKLARSGYFEISSPQAYRTEGRASEALASLPEGIWPAMMKVVCLNTNGTTNQDAGTMLLCWPKALEALPSSIRTTIAISFTSFLDQTLIRRSSISSLLHETEAARPGAEGTRFLSLQTWRDALSVASVVSPLFYATRDRTDGEPETDGEDDVGEGLPSMLVDAILPSPTSYWSPLTARLLVQLLSLYSEEEDLVDLLSRVVDTWAQAQRIKTSSWDQEVYLTTLILLLLAELPPAALSHMSTSSTLIAGISAHLEHSLASVRRVGMLVAETVSNVNGSTKPLSFGHGMWDGKGEGKEEARVLRAMHNGWVNREKSIGKLDVASVLTIFALEKKAMSVSAPSLPQAISRSRPEKAKSRVLPARHPAPSRKRHLIESLDDIDTLEEPNDNITLPPLTAIRGAANAAEETTPYVSDGESSSSSSKSSSSESDEDKSRDADRTANHNEFGLGIPHKKKRRAPVYIHELAPLLAEQDREANKLALRHTENLVRKKAGWGGEVDENATNLAISLLSLQNNFRFKNFEEKRKSALITLLCASPPVVAPCLAEQFFNRQFPMTQRICILNSLAFGARHISQSQKQDGMRHDQNAKMGLRTLADEFSYLAITRSRIEGGRRVPEIQRERSLRIQPDSSTGTLDTSSTRAATEVIAGSGNIYLKIAGSHFIFPLVTRFWAHFEQATSTRSRRARGGGSAILFDPFLVAAFLDTVAVLCYYAQNAADFLSSIVPEVINLGLTVTSTAVLHSFQEDEVQRGGSTSSVLGAAANLFLLLLDAVWQRDSGQELLRRNTDLVVQLEAWAGFVFESTEGCGGGDRAARSTAAVLLRISEMKQSVSSR